MVRRYKKKKSVQEKSYESRLKDDSKPNAAIIGAGPIGLLLAFLLRLFRFDVWVKETDDARKNVIKKLLGDKVQFFDPVINEHETMRFDLVVCCTSSRNAWDPEAYRAIFDLVKDRGFLYIFAGIDYASDDPLYDCHQTVNLENIHRHALPLGKLMDDGRLVFYGGHSGYREKAWDEAIKALPDWAPFLAKIITGIIEGFNSKSVRSWRPELKKYTPNWSSSDDNVPAIEYVLGLRPPWDLRMKHLKTTLISEKAFPLFKIYLKKKITKKDIGKTKSNYWTLQMSHDGIRLCIIYPPPRMPDQGEVLLKIIAVNPCIADSRAAHEMKKGRKQYVQALHNAMALIIKTNLEEGDNSINVGDIVVVMPHVYNAEQKKLKEYKEGNYFKIGGDLHLGIDTHGPGGEYLTIRAENCKVIPKEIILAVVDALRKEGEDEEEALKRACGVISELEHVACTYTALHLLWKWNKKFGGRLSQFLLDDDNAQEASE